MEADFLPSEDGGGFGGGSGGAFSSCDGSSSSGVVGGSASGAGRMSSSSSSSGGGGGASALGVCESSLQGEDTMSATALPSGAHQSPTEAAPMDLLQHLTASRLLVQGLECASGRKKGVVRLR